MRVAIIDCGTNTFHLLIVSIRANDNYKQLYKTKAIVKLGQDGITKNFISEEPFNRGVDTLKHFASKIAEHNVDVIYAYATAAVRKAKNGNDFIEAVKKQTGIAIELISGKREAELIYYGVRQAVQLGKEQSLVMDIGGGSVEFIICNQQKIVWKQSFELGAALLLEKLNPSNPITENEIKKLNTYLNKKLAPLVIACAKHKPIALIGSSGSFDTFAEMILHQQNKPPLKNKITYTFKMQDYKSVHQLLVSSTTAQRMKMKGLVKMRVDMIVLASLLLTFVIEKIKIKKMTLSAYALKEGMLFALIQK